MSYRLNVSRSVSSVALFAVALVVSSAAMVVSSVAMVVVGDQRLVAQVVVPTRAAEVAGPLNGAEVRQLPFAARDVAVHWRGEPDAVVEVGFSADGVTFGDYEDVGRDEVGEQRRTGETYGSVMFANGATYARLRTDRPLGRLSVLALADDDPAISWHTDSVPPAGAALAQPTVIPRSGWGADESLRFDGSGNEIWPPEFFPLQKMVVHHTATRNQDADPAATVRSIYYYHAVTQGWGDIGYSFLIDEAGRIYKGRNSHLPGSVNRGDDTITGEDGSGNVVTAGHALGVNQGSIGVAFLGTLTNQDTTPAAKSALEDLLAWDAQRHAIDPKGISLYVDPDGVTSPYTPTQPIPHILGHRDVNATECPGGAFYATLPAVRDAVASRLGGGTSDTVPPSIPTGLQARWAKRTITLTWTASTDDASGVAGYDIYRASAQTGPFTRIASTPGTTFDDTPSRRFNTYWYYIDAFDKAGNHSAASITVSATRL